VIDYARMADLVIASESLQLGPPDVSVLALAGWLNMTEVATLDRRIFAVVRLNLVHADLLP